ncbi:MAG: 50S ribosomal protein L18 [Saccharofermentanales bacterium]|jgi:large subunit ribosomal protein L18|nr:50S ribosomal protein L18 [Eubacteriales bacterium]MDD3611059.1 50S ribosomal protein L18 [Eubacteriales bacterium]HHU03578.1 50S ribosomal protein L18 [Fastidiosipila sp.]
MSYKESRNKRRLRRHARVRNKLHGTATHPRLCVFRSNAEIYAQLIDDDNGVTLAQASSLDKAIAESIEHGGNIEAAKAVGKLIAERTLEKDITTVIFDRGGYKYHGRVAALADAAREAGLSF